MRTCVTTPLYMRLLRDSWKELAEPVRRAHTTHVIVRAHGQLRVEHGRHTLARLLARMLGLPRPSPAATTRLTVTAHAGGERWERAINGRRLDSHQYASQAFELAERFGVIEFRFRLAPSDGSLVFIQREAAFVFGRVRVRIPASCAPRVEAREEPAGATRVKVDVRVALPGIGPLIMYNGVIDLEDTSA